MKAVPLVLPLAVAYLRSQFNAAEKDNRFELISVNGWESTLVGIEFPQVHGKRLRGAPLGSIPIWVTQELGTLMSAWAATLYATFHLRIRSTIAG